MLPDLDPHPGISANHVTWYVTGRLKAGTINLYSAYLLMHEALKLERQCYLLPAWQGKLYISGLLHIYFDYLTGMALNAHGEAAESAEWFIADQPLLKEDRAHFLTDRLKRGKALLEDRAFYELLSTLRSDDEGLSDDVEPVPTQVFPFHLDAPERELLKPGSEAVFQTGQELDPESSELYVELQIRG